jgi:hypothetical protein
MIAWGAVGRGSPVPLARGMNGTVRPLTSGSQHLLEVGEFGVESVLDVIRVT